MISTICVECKNTRLGRSELRYASDLAARFGFRLAVLVPQDSYLDWGAMDIFVQNNTSSQLVAHSYRSFLGNTLLEDQVGSGDILVGGAGLVYANTQHFLVPFEETVFSRTSVLEIMIPFGDGDSGVYAARCGIALAKQIRCGVILWHTTWRDEAVDSDDMSLHMCNGARKNLVTLCAMCEEQGVAYRHSIEGARDVSEGIVRAALREKSSLLVMAKGIDTGKGSYVDQVLKRSSVPVMIVGRSNA